MRCPYTLCACHDVKLPACTFVDVCTSCGRLHDVFVDVCARVYVPPVGAGDGTSADPVAVMYALRELKNNFKG